MASRIFKQQTLQKVIHDKTLDGDGTPQSPLGVLGGPFIADTPGSVSLSNLAADVYQSAVVELGGDFTAGEEVKCVRIGDQVTITGVGANLAHSSSSLPSSAATVIPAAFRPTNNIVNEYGKSATDLRSIIITSGGQLFLSYRNYSGSNTSRTDSGSPPILTYNIT